MAEDNDFKLTEEEVDRFKEAMKKEEFRKLLCGYAQEISNPENKKRYEEELTKLENERGVDVKFLHLTPSFVIKTHAIPSKKKTFINITQTELVGPPTSAIAKSKDGKRGQQWFIPYSLSLPRDDIDKTQKKYTIIDVAFNPDAFKRIEEDSRFTDLLISTAFEGIENELKIKLDSKRIKRLKRPYKGIPQTTVIRRRMSNDSQPVKQDSTPFTIPYPPLREEQLQKSAKVQHKKKIEQKPKNEPKYNIVHRGEFDMLDFTYSSIGTSTKRPKELVITIQLPKLDSTKEVELDIFEKQLVLNHQKPDYNLNLALPYPINEETCSAKFEKSSHNLIITLPVLPPLPLPTPLQLTTPTLVEPIDTSCDEVTNQISEPSEAKQTSPTKTLKDNEKESTNHIELSKSCDSTIRSDWSVHEEWQCPSFSYQQNNDSISFVLHVSFVKATTMISHFDVDSFQLTFKGGVASTEYHTRQQSYSFYVKFQVPEDCSLKPDECKIDIGDDNIVIVIVKSNDKEFQRFDVGSGPYHTEEKLFLTETNCIDVIHTLQPQDDVWYNADSGSDNVSVNVLECNSEQAIVEVIKEKEDVKQWEENEKKGERNSYKENSITKEEDVICDVLVNDTVDMPTQQSFTKSISDKEHEEKYNDEQEEKKYNRKERNITKEQCDVTNERDPINGKITEETKDTIKFSNTLLFDLD